MNVGILVMAGMALALAGCKTTETAAVEDERHVEVIIKDGEASNHMVLHIERDGEDPIHIEGDPNSPEVKEALAKLEAEGMDLHSDHIILSDEDGEDGSHVFVMKMDGDGEKSVIRDGEKIVIRKHTADGDETRHEWIVKGDQDGKHEFQFESGHDVRVEDGKVWIKEGDEERVIELPKDGSKTYEFITKEEIDETSGAKRVHKKVIVVTGDDEQFEFVDGDGKHIKIEVEVDEDDDEDLGDE